MQVSKHEPTTRLISVLTIVIGPSAIASRVRLPRGDICNQRTVQVAKCIAHEEASISNISACMSHVRARALLHRTALLTYSKYLH